jgi:superfamily II DNA/RNA helicase
MKFYAVGYLLGLFPFPKEFWDWSAEFGCGQGFYGWEFKGTQKDILRLHKEIYPNRAARMAIADLGDMFPENQLTAELYTMDNQEEIEQAYADMEEELADLHNREREDHSDNRLTIILRNRQKVELLKVPTIVELAKDYEESGNNVVIFCNFNQTIDALVEKLDTDCVIRGGQTREERDRQIDLFQREEKHIIICNIEAGGVGISLHDKIGSRQRISLILPNFSAQSLVQAVGRIWRAGGKSKAIQRIIFTARTIEDQICNSVRKKVNNINTLNDGDLIKGLKIEPEAFNDYQRWKGNLDPTKMEELLRQGKWKQVNVQNENGEQNEILL